MLAAVRSATLQGVEARPVTVEVHVSNGLPGFTIVGLPDAACREARDRVRAALLSSGCSWPMRRVTVNLAPSALPKVGAGLDLAMALGLLAAVGALDTRLLEGCTFFGELGLDGSLRAVPGTLALVSAVEPAAVVVPPAVLAEARLAGGSRVRCVRSLRELLDAVTGSAPWPQLADGPPPPAPPEAPWPAVDLAEVRGQAVARRALEVAAAGGHHLLLVGPPGAGKTLLARCLAGLLPPLEPEVALEVARVRSAAGLAVQPPALARPPFRAPHHTSSTTALLGGGASCRPGEVSLASGGVLFLDELGEFPVPVLDALRQPLEEGVVRLARAGNAVGLPARFLLVAAANPCPCGAGLAPGCCRCPPVTRRRYARRLSAPLLDRIDLQVLVAPAGPEELLGTAAAEASVAVAKRVAAARAVALRRGDGCSARLAAARLDALATLSPAAKRLLGGRLATGALSARSLAGVRRVARTLADLAGEEGAALPDEHVAEALALRSGGQALLGAGS